MFHLISSAMGGLLAATTTVAVIGLIALVLSRLRPAKPFWRRLGVGALLALTVMGLSPVGDWMLEGLESRFARYEPDGRPVAGIILLGGAVGQVATSAGPRAQPNQAVDRLFETVRLARRLPSARVLISGGPEDPRTHISEADLTRAYLVGLGIAPGRIILERASRDTFENARFSSAVVKPKSGERWVLVTSAFHMARAVGCFRHAGFDVQPAPADWRVRGVVGSRWSVAANLAKVDLAAREYAGLLVYRLRGRTNVLFARP